ncbi:unnamed protein product [Prunus brigantina]
MAKFDGERSWDIHDGSKGASSSSLTFLGSLSVSCLELAPSMCWNLPAALFNEPADLLYVASIFPAKG